MPSNSYKGMSQAAIARAKAAEAESQAANTAVAEATKSDVDRYREAVETFRVAHQVYINARYVPQIDGALSDAMFDLLEAIPWDAPRPEEWNPFFTALDLLRERWDTYNHRLDREKTPDEHPVWYAVELVYDNLARLTPPKPEPEKEIEPIWLLWQQGVSAEQIGRIHRLVDEHGNGQAHLVMRCVHDRNLDPKTLDRNAPKTELDYFFEGLDEHQVARMLGKSPFDMEAMWAEFREKYGSLKYQTPEEKGAELSEKRYWEKQRAIARETLYNNDQKTSE